MEPAYKYLTENPKTLPMMLMRKFRITLQAAKDIRARFECSRYDSETDSESPSAQEVSLHTHIATE